MVEGGVELMNIASEILSDLTTYMKYARYDKPLRRRETWNELVTRNKEMQIQRFPNLKSEIDYYYQWVYDKKVLPSMRGLQFGGKAIDINPARQFNCSFLHMDHYKAFSEVMFLLLSGCGVGYSVQQHHVEKLPTIKSVTARRRYVIDDSIQGWADAINILIKSYLLGVSRPVFDFRQIREKGAELVTSGGKAPGPEPLKECLFLVEQILERKKEGEKLTTVEVHDINCHIADAVLSGGIRRAAMIALFSFNDEEMLTCKFGNWYESNPQRGRSNNSAVIVRHKIKKEDFLKLWGKIQASGCGEPGFFFTNNAEWGLNPCAEISLRTSQFCNLSTINGSNLESEEDFVKRCEAAAFIGTLQAAYTDFFYLRDCWRKTTEKEALIGVSITGVASGQLTDKMLAEGSAAVVRTNKTFAEILGINPAARTTCIKPEGTSSLVLGTSSGVHSWHDTFYIRRIRVGKNEAIYKFLKENCPELVEDEYFKPHLQAVISVPQKAPQNAILRSKETALEMLERVKSLHESWIVNGHNKGENQNNVSATVTIKKDEWETTGEWLWDNKDVYTALSFLPFDDHSYIQAPFETCTEEVYEQMVSSLHGIDLTQVIEDDDYTTNQDNLACAGGVCEII